MQLKLAFAGHNMSARHSIMPMAPLMTIRRFVLVAWICASILVVRGESPTGSTDYSMRLWQMEDGLPHNIVQAITQTRDGYLWIGTREGLARFDGSRFQSVELLHEARLLSITALRESKDGSLWIGTDSLGVMRLREGRVERCKGPGGELDFSVQDIQEGGDGGIWISSSYKIFRWANGQMEQKAEFRHSIQTLCVDAEGAVWTAGGGNLRRLDGNETNKLVRVSGLPSPARRLYRDGDGTFWLGAANGMVQIKDGTTKSFKKADGPTGFISVIYRDTAGVLWAGTYSGISRFLGEDFLDQNEADAPAYRVYSIYEDRERNLWIGSEEGLARLTARVFKTITKRDGLTLNTVATVCASPNDGVWISAWGGGLNHWESGKITSLSKSNGLSSNFIMAMCASRDGGLWAGADYGAALNHIQGEVITVYDQTRGFIGRPSTATTALYEDARGVLWIGSRELLQRWDGTNFSSFSTENGITHQKINAICGGADDSLWIGTDGGLTRYHDGKFVDLAKTEPRLRVLILSLYEDGDHVLWIGTKEHGLLRWQNGVVHEFTSTLGLFSDVIYSVLEDNHTNLWLNSSRGIFRVSKSQIDAVIRGQRAAVNSISYGKADGVLSSGQYREVTQPSACKDSDGHLWFRTTQGVAVVNPDRVKANDMLPPVVIQEVVADKEIVGSKSLGLEVEREITVKPGRGELEIQYAALSYRAAEKNQFRYKLEGVDLNWVEAGTRRTAFYNNLAPGSYRFRVIACNNDGAWNETGATVALVLRPHFWQTRTFIALLILGSLGFVGGGVRYVTRRRMQRRLVLLEQQHAVEKERARIARDMHDELGAKLTRISFQGAMARQAATNPPETDQHIAKMSETARELVQSLDQIVWAVDPENDSLESLANYICRYASEFFENSPIDCKFSIPRELPPCHISTEVRHNLFLAVKEALNNALKHSVGKRVVLTISADAEKLTISIADDGQGMGTASEPAKNKRTGHGLGNMRERLNAIRGNMELKSEGGRGTEVRFVVPL